MKSLFLPALCLCCAVNLHAADTNAPAAPYILTPPAPATPRINGPNVFGVRPGSPFLYTIPATGDRPMTFSAKNLPAGLKLDSQAGRITGSLPKAMPMPANVRAGYFLFHPAQVSSRQVPGNYVVTLRAQNSLGAAEKKFSINVGDQIALTPPMGWNSWNCFAGAVSEEKVKSAADAMVKSGLINHGWTYINVDDFWQNHRNSKDQTLRGEFRDKRGNIVPNSRFPDMKGMADYIHGLGLKAGLYSSPGPWTCGGCAASWQHEEQDAQTYAKWGFDYLKYDWCSYGNVVHIAKTNVMAVRSNGSAAKTGDEAIYPYKVMGNFLREQNRDIVFSLCQYGMADVWKWGGSVNGNCWRTTGDITDTWRSMSNIGFKQDQAAPYAHISLWCLLSAPLLIGCDMTKLDDFTLNLLENDEVLALDQDALGKQATCVVTNGDVRVYEKELEDGGRALGFFNLGSEPANLEFNQLASLGFTGAQHVRDLWRQTNLPDVAAATGVLKITIPVHGVVLYKLTAVK
jgi:alpha-galactosidase